MTTGSSCSSDKSPLCSASLPSIAIVSGSSLPSHTSFPSGVVVITLSCFSRGKPYSSDICTGALSNVALDAGSIANETGTILRSTGPWSSLVISGTDITWILSNGSTGSISISSATKTSGSSISSLATIVASVNGSVVTASVKGASGSATDDCSTKNTTFSSAHTSSSLSPERLSITASSSCSTGEVGVS